MKMIWNNLKQNIILAFGGTIVAALVLCVIEIYMAKTTAVAYNIELWIDACNILDFFFPLLVTLPFCWRIYFERKDKYIEYVCVREEKKKYIFKKILSGMISSFSMVYVSYFVGLVVAVYVVNPEVVMENDILQRYLFGTMQAEQPLLFGIFWCVWKAFIGALICGFGYVVALVVDNLFVIALLPFIYCTLENFVTATLRLEKYSFCTSYILNRLSPDSMKISNCGIGVVSFLVVGSVIILGLFYRKKQVEVNG